MAGQWCRGGQNEAGQAGKHTQDDPSQHDHATIMPQVGERPRDGVGSSRIQYLRITTVGSGTAGTRSNSRSPPDYEFATDRLAILPQLIL